jgi:plasmid stabilization system protein ParE
VNEYILSEDANLDSDNIWEYITQDSLDAADRWIGKLFDAFEAIAQAPGIGHKREDVTGHPVLFFPVGAYLHHLSRYSEACRNCCHKAHATFPVFCKADPLIRLMPFG